MPSQSSALAPPGSPYRRPHMTSTSSLKSTHSIDDDAASPNSPSGRSLPMKSTLTRRLSGRIASSHSPSAFLATSSIEVSPALTAHDASPRVGPVHHQQEYESLLTQVSEWLRCERESVDVQLPTVALNKLERILEENRRSLQNSKSSRGSSRGHRRPYLHGSGSFDSENLDGDVVVPSCDAVLCQPRTGSSTLSQQVNANDPNGGPIECRDWLSFKSQIVRLAHTLRIHGWRRVPLDNVDGVCIDRLTGALTNCVYCVTPPPNLPSALGIPNSRPPQRLLLRLYGENSECLIDREQELAVLRRLTRKRIGPRVLGTFTNGRFEEYLNSTTLTCTRIREPETSRQIAKRMRELHDGVDLLPVERERGPVVWRNWDSWLNVVQERAILLDRLVSSSNSNSSSNGVGSSNDVVSSNGISQPAGTRQYLCGLPWPDFKAMVERNKAYVEATYQQPGKLRASLVFAHNDTQYGNILRMRPDDEKSPLLLPQNEHKQLVVIDFEYAGPNTVGLEFANHFTEWTYNYHLPTAPHRCDISLYPTPEQQRRFVQAYVDHSSQSSHSASSAPLVDFALDSRPPSGGWREAELQRDEQTSSRVRELLDEALLWRAANSAQWVAWAIIRADIAGMNDSPDTLAEEASDSFDYLGYARDRALFFWADCILLGLIDEHAFPSELREQIRLKRVEH